MAAWRSLLPLPFLLALAAPVAAQAQEAAQGVMPPLLTEPLTEAWRDHLVPPLVSRLSGLGLYVARETPTAVIAQQLRATPNALALTRRSTYRQALAGESGLEAIEIGPAACLLLAVRADRPWAAYADLNYAAPGLRLETSGPVATSLLDGLKRALPLPAAGAPPEERPLRVAFQRLIRGEADVVAFDAPRRSGAQVPALAARLAADRGLRLLAMPVMAEASAMAVGEVQLEEASWFQEAATHATVCDPFLLVLRRDQADRLLYRLYDGDAAARAAGGPSFVTQVKAAARNLGSLLGLPGSPPAPNG
jgi:hypothetical protein